MKQIPIILIFLTILFSSCNDSSQLSLKSEGDNSNSKGITPIQYKIPPGGCPAGTIWDNSIGQCVPDVPDPVINDKGDIAVGNISFNGSVTEGPAPAPYEGYTQKVTAGQTIKSRKYSKLQLFYHGQPTNEILIVGIKNQNGYIYGDYYDKNGKRFGQVVVSANDVFLEWRPTYSGGADSPDYNSRGFFGQWGRCVGIVFGQMSAGTAIGSAAAIGCAVYGAVCAGTIATYCVIAAIHLNY